MKFRTEIPPLRHQGLLTHSDAAMMIGSCFTTSVGSRLQRDGFDVCINQFGTLYNPASIADVLARIASRTYFDDKDVVRTGNMCHTFASHSSMSRRDPAELIDLHNIALDRSAEFLKRARVLIITLGTAWAFTLRSTGRIVANCHKIPASEFERRRMTVEQAAENLTSCIHSARTLRPDINVIFTVSPIRHAADGAHGNQISKSTLLLAVDEICSGTDGCIYFPSYEAIIDDLRDYRFYAADMRHPSEVAVDYVYTLFAKSFFTSATESLAEQCRALRARCAHRPLTDDTEAISRFRDETMRLRSKLLDEHPYLKNNFDNI